MPTPASASRSTARTSSSPARAREIRLPVGQYTVQGVKDGKVVSRELVTVTKDGRQVVRISQEPMDTKAEPSVQAIPPKKHPPAARAPFPDADIQRIAALPPAQRYEEVVKELKRRNPGFEMQPWSPNATELRFSRAAFEEKLTDIAPLRALPLKTLLFFKHAVSDLSPLKGMSLTELYLGSTRVVDLTPLKGMPLRKLGVAWSPVTDLSPLQGMKLESLDCSFTKVSNLVPLKGMPLTRLVCVNLGLTDLSPLKGMKLTHLDLVGNDVPDLSPLKDMPLTYLRVTAHSIERNTPLLRHYDSDNHQRQAGGRVLEGTRCEGEGRRPLTLGPTRSVGRRGCAARPTAGGCNPFGVKTGRWQAVLGPLYPEGVASSSRGSRTRAPTADRRCRTRHLPDPIEPLSQSAHGVDALRSRCILVIRSLP